MMVLGEVRRALRAVHLAGGGATKLDSSCVDQAGGYNRTDQKQMAVTLSDGRDPANNDFLTGASVGTGLAITVDGRSDTHQRGCVNRQAGRDSEKSAGGSGARMARGIAARIVLTHRRPSAGPVVMALIRGWPRLLAAMDSPTKIRNPLRSDMLKACIRRPPHSDSPLSAGSTKRAVAPNIRLRAFL